MSSRSRALLATVLLVGAATAEAAEDPQTTKAVEKVSLEDLTGRLNLAIPQSPAFTMLGVSPEKVVQSDNFREVALGVLHGLDARGNLQSGIAVDVRPYMVIKGASSTLAHYREHLAVRLLTNTQLSFATASGKSDSDKADRLGLGLRMVLWQEYDPARGGDRIALQYVPAKGGETAPNVTPNDDVRNPQGKGKVAGSLDSCYISYLSVGAESPDVLPGDVAGLSELEEDIARKAREAVKQCLEPFKKRYWNAGSLDVGIGGYRSKVDPLSESGFGAWLGYSHSIGEKGQLVARALSTENVLQPVKDSPGQYQAVDENSAGLRLRYGSDRGALMLEGEWTESRPGAGDKDSYTRAAIGLEFEAFRDVWLQLGVGKAFSTELFDDDPVYSGQIRLGFAEQSLFKQ
jgi:hypothetical protein